MKSSAARPNKRGRKRRLQTAAGPGCRILALGLLAQPAPPTAATSGKLRAVRDLGDDVASLLTFIPSPQEAAGAPQLCPSTAVGRSRRGVNRKRITGSAQMLLRYDLRPDREGWTVFDVTTDRPAFFEELPLVGLPLDDEEKAVNALNTMEIKSPARRKVLDEGTAWLYKGSRG